MCELTCGYSCHYHGHHLCADVLVDRAEATVDVCKVRGIPDPQRRADDSPQDFPVITYSYFVTYDFVGQQSCDNKVTITFHSLFLFHITKLSLVERRITSGNDLSVSRGNSSVLTKMCNEKAHTLRL